MDATAFRRLVSGERRGLGAAVARSCLSFASIGYGAAMRVRNDGYTHQLIKQTKAAIPVVSIGNLTLGGTGKTPMVEAVARWYRGRGVRVAIASRGYGAAGGVNDEALVLEENLPDCPHLLGTDRAELARIAFEELEAELLILDDGFQHRRLARDLDIVLLDALDPFGHGRLFPRGLLREPVSSLRRADLVVLSRADAVDRDGRAAIRSRAERLARGPLDWVEARHAPRAVRNSGGDTMGMTALRGVRTGAFCGIGNPGGFRRTLADLGVEVVEFIEFPDHHKYTRSDVATLGDRFRAAGVDLALTTQKDSVKLRTANIGSARLFSIEIGIEFLEGEELLNDRLRRLVEKSGRIDQPTISGAAD